MGELPCILFDGVELSIHRKGHVSKWSRQILPSRHEKLRRDKCTLDVSPKQSLNQSWMADLPDLAA